MNCFLVVFICVIFLQMYINFAHCKKSKGDKPDWAKKDVRDFTDADLERLYDQWEEDDEPLEPDELPEHLRPSPKIDLTNIDPSNPENLLQLSKKGKTLMAFVTVSGNPTQEESDKITKLWQTSLMNNHINVERFTISSDRAIFMFKDGSQAWEAKDFLVKQERLEHVTIENKEYAGEHSKLSKSQKEKEEL